MTEPDINYERLPHGMAMDETDVNLRAYFSRLSDERLRQYDASWTDEQVTSWDDNFRDDGILFLVCCERDVDIEEYRRVLAEHIRFRFHGVPR